MAKKFFNSKVKKKKKSSLAPILIIVVCAIALLALIILILSASKEKIPKDAKVVIRKEVEVELNSNLPDKTLFFTELENIAEDKISVDFKDADLTVPGTYQVVVKVYNKEYSSSLLVIDNVAPELVTKEYSINPGDHYEAKDFVKSCVDNSKRTCIYEFYDKASDAKGNPIDFSSYSKVGKYKVFIIAKDESGNATQPVEAELKITRGSADPENTCEYGKGTLAKGAKITVDITVDGCAIDLNLYKNVSIVEPANKVVETEKTKLQDEFKKYNLNVKDIYFDASIEPVLNETSEGLIGYLVTINVSIVKGNEKEVIERYTVNGNGTRSYSINKYNLQ